MPTPTTKYSHCPYTELAQHHILHAAQQKTFIHHIWPFPTPDDAFWASRSDPKSLYVLEKTGIDATDRLVNSLLVECVLTAKTREILFRVIVSTATLDAVLSASASTRFADKKESKLVPFPTADPRTTWAILVGANVMNTPDGRYATGYIRFKPYFDRAWIFLVKTTVKMLTTALDKPEIPCWKTPPRTWRNRREKKPQFEAPSPTTSTSSPTEILSETDIDRAWADAFEALAIAQSSPVQRRPAPKRLRRKPSNRDTSLPAAPMAKNGDEQQPSKADIESATATSPQVSENQPRATARPANQEATIPLLIGAPQTGVGRPATAHIRVPLGQLANTPPRASPLVPSKKQQEHTETEIQTAPTSHSPRRTQDLQGENGRPMRQFRAVTATRPRSRTTLQVLGWNAPSSPRHKPNPTRPRVVSAPSRHQPDQDANPRP
ncbi:hypothetical protein MKEN_00306700 [Mycena kentingensis (nom. inval.)]|nr:hypothetical protein MKEN_00306700 [Mycena kentingensis (nom. inval.)]